MPLMFMISGYVHALTDRFNDARGWFCHVRKNFVSIYLPYLWFSYFGWTVSLMIFRGNSNPINYNMAQFWEIVHIPYMGFREYWFLCTLFQIKLIHTAFEHKFRSLLPCCIFWTLMFILMNSFKSSLPVWIYRLQFGMYFHVGYILKTKNFFTSPKHPSLLSGIILLTAGSALHFLPPLQQNISAIASAVCTCLGLFTVFYNMNFCPALLTLSGSTSMVMFIVHDYVIFSLALAFKFTGIFSDMPFAAAVLTFILAVSVPIMLVKLYKNVETLRWIEYIFYPGKRTSATAPTYTQQHR